MLEYFYIDLTVKEAKGPTKKRGPLLLLLVENPVSEGSQATLHI